MLFQIFRITSGFTLSLLMVAALVASISPAFSIIAIPVVIGIWAYVVWKGWGDYLVNLGKYDQAIEYFTRKINSDPVNPGFYNNRGNAYYLKGDGYAALRDYKKALELEPKSAIAYTNLGNAYVKIGDDIAALTSFENALFLQPQNPQIFNNRGILLKKQKRIDEALADFNEAIRLSPKFSSPYYLRGNILFERQDYFTALKNYQYAQKCKPKLYAADAGVAITFHVMGNLRRAQKTWNALVKRIPSYQDPEWLLSELQWTESLLDEARQLIAALDT